MCRIRNVLTLSTSSSNIKLLWNKLAPHLWKKYRVVCDKTSQVIVCAVWMYSLCFHHFYFFLHCGAVFTEERHCRDKYDQNCEGTKVAEGCFLIFGDKGDWRLFLGFECFGCLFIETCGILCQCTTSDPWFEFLYGIYCWNSYI